MTVNYAIRHLTRFTYTGEVTESVMELRMRPRSEGMQRCLQFDLDLSSRARVFVYRDFHGNWVHHFDLPRRHSELALTARSLVEVSTVAEAPERLPQRAWQDVDGWAAGGEHWDFRQPSQFAVWTPLLVAFSDSLGRGVSRDVDVLTAVRTAMAAIHGRFEYAANTTRVDSPIDEALTAGRGVCQDYTHILLAMLRRLGLPCRYVSGYIAPGSGTDAAPTTNATHAWVDVLLPELGWVGVDPTNNVVTGPRHIRVAIGRDYADVPPTRGVFKGGAASALAVSVDVVPVETPTMEPALGEPVWTADVVVDAPAAQDRQRPQQQQ